MARTSRKRPRQQIEDTLGQVSSESSAVIEALLQLMGALKGQPGFDGEAFDEELARRIGQVPADMPLSKLILKAAATLPHRPAKTVRRRKKAVPATA